MFLHHHVLRRRLHHRMEVRSWGTEPANLLAVRTRSVAAEPDRRIRLLAVHRLSEDQRHGIAARLRHEPLELRQHRLIGGKLGRAEIVLHVDDHHGGTLRSNNFFKCR
jgi:hypothetical protein